MSKLKPEIKQLWVENLEAGEYKQTQKCLKDEEGYCCLGVLDDLYINKTQLGIWKEIADKSYIFQDNTQSQESTLTDTVIDWAFKDLENSVEIYDTLGELIRLNDECNSSFKEIASYIKENL